MNDKCPANHKIVDCRDCRFGKEGLCDWPYDIMHPSPFPKVIHGTDEEVEWN